MQKIKFLFLIGLFLSCNSHKKQPKENISTEKEKAVIVQKLTGKEIVSELEKLDFFNITDESELETAKKHIAESKDKWNFFSGTMRGETIDYIDNRFFTIDCETLFEAEGLIEYLDNVKVAFSKLGLKLNYANEKSKQSENYWKHTIELNGIEYTAFEGTFTDHDWEIAYVNFISMLNKLLKIQNNENRFYPIKCDNDGKFVLLTFQQFNFIKTHYPNDNEHPKKLSDWKKMYGL